MRIEVFKTNVKDPGHAQMILDQIHGGFSEYAANFDLDDCDKILRVVSDNAVIDTLLLMNLLKAFGVDAEVLADEIPEIFQF